MGKQSGKRAPRGADTSRTRGAAAVEFALVLPLLILLVFGIFEFGRAYNAKVTLTHAAREAVRDYTINGGSGWQTIGQNAAPQLSGVIVTLTDPCDTTPGDTAEVTVTWDLAYNIPLFQTGTLNLAESAVMRCGG